MKLNNKKADVKAAQDRLREWLKDGDTLWFIMRHRSASGMMRTYSVKQLECSDAKVSASDLTSNIAQACGYGWSESYWGLKIQGCGFSAEQDISDTVGRLLGIKLRYETL